MGVRLQRNCSARAGANPAVAHATICTVKQHATRPTLVTVDEVAQIVRCHPTTVRRAVAAGDLRVGHVGHGPKAQMRIAPADVARWIAANDRGSR
jgi:excisionase family DNA binding protein